ncbi:hypothetical protein EZS27_044194, partial [termite gut metagenome]
LRSIFLYLLYSLFHIRLYIFLQQFKLRLNLDSRKHEEIGSLLLKANERRKETGSYNLACLYALTGKDGKACQYLEENLKNNQGIRGRDFIENDVGFTTLKASPRFRQLLDKYFPPEES